MLESLIEFDRLLFLFINVSLANPVTDFVMPLVTSNLWLRAFYAAAMITVLWKGDTRLRWLVLFSILALAMSDQLAASFLKPLIGRIRPCHSMENINLLVGCGGGKAMPSAHATNAFAQAILFGVLYSRVRYWLLGLAFLIAISRVFVGVHYPGDILAGAVLGSVVGLAVIWLYRYWMEWYDARRKGMPDAGAD